MSHQTLKYPETSSDSSKANVQLNFALFLGEVNLALIIRKLDIYKLYMGYIYIYEYLAKQSFLFYNYLRWQSSL